MKRRNTTCHTCRTGVTVCGRRGPIGFAILATALVVQLGLLAGPAGAWGPHPQITIAAAKCLPHDAPLLAFLDADLGTLGNVSWMPDITWNDQLVHIRGSRYHARDFLIFPGFRGVGHMQPQVVDAYEPTFRRAVQALRTETRANAFGWLGTLIHYTEDTGAPPHAFPVTGPSHGKMENWLDAKKIILDGYEPRLLGATDDEALAGYLERMRQLTQFAEPRGRVLLPMAEADQREAMEPIILECALESARAVADLLLTLDTLLQIPQEGTGELQGTIQSAAVPGSEQIPAKVLLADTTYATYADAEGRYVFRNLPPADYQMTVLRAGNAPARTRVTVASGRTTHHDLAMPPSDPPGNLFRNADFSVRWLDSEAPHHWDRRARSGEPAVWLSQRVPVVAGRRYRLAAAWRRGADGSVQLAWGPATAADSALHREAPLAAGRPTAEFTAPEGAQMAQVILHVPADDPAEALEHAALIPLSD